MGVWFIVIAILIVFIYIGYWCYIEDKKKKKKKAIDEWYSRVPLHLNEEKIDFNDWYKEQELIKFKISIIDVYKQKSNFGDDWNNDSGIHDN